MYNINVIKRRKEAKIMKMYVDKNYKVYTEETINEEITNRMKKM